MSVASKEPVKALSADPVFRIANSKTSALDRFTDYFSDQLSPILIKETRQSLKSRQFFWTFFVLLVAVVLWTMIGLSTYDASVEFGTTGASLLVGYWVILGIPLAIIIPSGAYRSLSREFEDGTIQLVSVTTMKAWQIIAGKLGSAMLQMLVYVSVFAPCIAFTYLLRGISIPQIFLGMLFCVVGCFGLTCVSLFFAGANRSRLLGVGISILLILFQIFVWIIWCSIASAIAFGQIVMLSRDDGVFLSFGIVSFFFSLGMLMFAGAASTISFEADNRSTLVRIMMLVQQFLFIAFATCSIINFRDIDGIFMLSMFTAHYWLLMGLVLIGEPEQLSARVKRSIPKSYLGRAITAFFLPGSGRGLLFAICNTWLCVAIFTIISLIAPWFPEITTVAGNWGRNGNFVNWGNGTRVVMASCLAVIYPTFYLSLLYLFCSWLRKHGFKITGRLSLLLGVLMVISISGVLLLFHYNILQDHRWQFYSVEQTLNWHWTASEFFNNGFANGNLSLITTVVVLMSAVSAIAILRASRELLQEQAATPERVHEENERMKKFDRPPPGETIDDIFAEQDDRDSPPNPEE